MKQLILISTIIFCSYGQMLNAQAYDGRMDFKLFGGYFNQGGKSGFELMLDMGQNKFLSYGAKVHFAYKVPSYPNTDTFSNALFFMNGHFSNILRMNPKVDPYVGFCLGAKSLGSQAGIRYNFSEYFGTYFQYYQPFYRSLFTNTDSDFYKKPAFSLGLTFNLF